jgi:hypothetical protein
MEDLLERVVAIADAFDRAGVPHSFGGAIALGFYAEVRLTHDIDINVYLGVDDADRALESLYALGVPIASPGQRDDIRRDGQTRLRWDHIPIDLFFWNLDFHRSCAERRRLYDLLGREIAVLSPEDLIVCKVAFGRAKDAIDIRGMIRSVGAELDIAYVRRWVTEIVATDAPAVRDLERALDDAASAG